MRATPPGRSGDPGPTDWGRARVPATAKVTWALLAGQREACPSRERAERAWAEPSGRGNGTS